MGRRKSITKNPTLWKWLILYWFSDASETWGTREQNYINNWYGVYEIYDRDYEGFKKLNWFRKFLLSYQWAALRNPNWNFQMLFNPKTGEKYDVNPIICTGNGGHWSWRNYTKRGKQFITWRVDGTKYFRFSFTKKAHRYDPLRLISSLWRRRWCKHVNVQLGASTNRYILKLRYF